MDSLDSADVGCGTLQVDDWEIYYHRFGVANLFVVVDA